MKKFFCAVPLVLGLCFSFACQDKTATAELEKFRAQAKLEEVNKDLAKRVMEALNKEDLVALKELMAPEFVRYSPSTTIDIHSLDEFSEFVKMLHSSLPDIHLSIEESYAAGDRVTIRYMMSATHKGEFMGMPATGNKLGTSGVLIFRIENGKVAEIREEYDSVGFMQQLGMELKPIAAEKKGKEVSEEPAMRIEAEKQSVAERFQALVDTAVKGDIEKYKSFFHPEMRWWDFSQKDPVGIEDYTKYMEEFSKSGLKWVSELGPFEIHIIGKTAVLYTTYKNIFKDPEGKETTSSGPWAAVLVKQDDRWMFLSNIFAAK